MVGRKTRLIFDAGDIIFREGEAGEVAYLVEKGSVQLSKRDKYKSAVVEIIRDGIFALLPLVDNLPRQYTATAREETILTVISRSTFEKRLSNSDPAIRAVVHYLTRSLREASDRLTGGGVLDMERGDTR